MVKNLPAMQETWVWSLGRKDPLRRKWQPTPVFLPGESHGQRNLVGYIHGVTKSQTPLSDWRQRFASRKTIPLPWEAMPITEPHLCCPDQSERSSQDNTVCPRFLPGSHFHGNKLCWRITLLPSPAATTENILIHFFSVYSHCRNFAVDLNLIVNTPQLHFKCCLLHVSS